MLQFPPLSHLAIASQSGLADAVPVARANGAPRATPATTMRARVRVAAWGLRLLAIRVSLPRLRTLWTGPQGRPRPRPGGSFTRGFISRIPAGRGSALWASGVAGWSGPTPETVRITGWKAKSKEM